MKILKSLVIVAIAVSVGFLSASNSSAQAPENLSFLTNQTALVSWALKRVNEIHVDVYVPAVNKPFPQPVLENSTPVTPSETSKIIPYSGPATLTAMAKAMKGTRFTPKSPIPNSTITVSVQLVEVVKKEKGDFKQYLLGGAVSGIPVNDGSGWRLPEDYSKAPIFLYGNIVIPVPGIARAWVVETNMWGWSVSKALDVWDGFVYFDTTLAGECTLCMEVWDKGGISTWVYDLHGNSGGTGIKQPMTPVLIEASLRDSEQIRDYGLDNAHLGHWLWSYKPENSLLNYGRVPLMIATYTAPTNVVIWCGSAAGYAKSFIVTRLADKVSPEVKFEVQATADGKEGVYYAEYMSAPGAYHIQPMGIDVCPDWWKVSEVNGWNNVKGKAVAPVPVTAVP
jgi:hypothetical protein